jgi:pimeloyl-ACP methyl ester carboxylesterase
MDTNYSTIDVNGTKIFNWEAGSPTAPALLLLHGFPSSSHMFRNLIPVLPGQFHLVAPDFLVWASRTCPIERITNISVPAESSKSRTGRDLLAQESDNRETV